jgi:ElaB/YqjD/DUF883 family membrane-anchored ribosome-binding protein
MTISKQSATSDGMAAGSNGSTGGDTDLQGLRDDVARLTQQIADLLVATGEETLDDMKTQMQRARQGVDDLVVDARGKGKDAVDAAREAADPIIKGVEEAVQKHPVLTIALALGLGLAFGAALRR